MAHRSKFSRIIWLLSMGLLLAAFIGFTTTSPAAAQDTRPGLSMQAKAAYDGYFKYGEWLPIYVTFENNGTDIQGEVRVQVFSSGIGSSYSAPAELASGARKRIPLYVLLNNFARQVQVELVENGEVIASTMIEVTPQANVSYIVGLLMPERSTIPLISSVQFPGQPRQKLMVDLTLEDIPERPEALRSLDLIIINDTDTSSLTPKQIFALKQWIRGGGRLVLGGGPGVQKVAAGLTSLIPLQLESGPNGITRMEDLSSLVSFAGADAIRVPGPFLISSGSPLEGVTLAEQDGLPLVQEVSLGIGYVDFIALDLAASPFDAWSGIVNFWETLLSPGAAYSDWMPLDMSTRQMRANSIYYALTNLPMLDLPSVRELALLLIVYVLLVGPTNYLFLRWRNKTHMAWLTIPLLTLVFSAGAFGVGHFRRGSDLVLNKISVFNLDQSGSAQVVSFVGLFSPGQQSYEMEVIGEGLLSPVSPYYDPWSSFSYQATTASMEFVQSQPAILRGLTVSQGSMQGFMHETSIEDFGQLNGNLQILGNRIVGVVNNQLPYPLENAVLLIGNQVERLEDIPANGSVVVDVQIADASKQPFYQSPLSYRVFEKELQGGTGQPQREAETRRAVLEGVFDQGGYIAGTYRNTVNLSQSAIPVILFGWLEAAQPEVRIARQAASEQVTGLVYTSLTVEVAGDAAFSLSPGVLQGHMTATSGNASLCGDYWSSSYYLGAGQMTYEYSLPTNLSNRVDQLQFNIVSERGWLSELTLNMYDWNNETWQSFEPVQGMNLINSPVNFINPDGLVRLQLDSKDNFGSCVNFSLGIQGSN